MLLLLNFHRVYLECLVESGQSCYYDYLLAISKGKYSIITPSISVTKIHPKIGTVDRGKQSLLIGSYERVISFPDVEVVEIWTK